MNQLSQFDTALVMTSTAISNQNRKNLTFETYGGKSKRLGPINPPPPKYYEEAFYPHTIMVKISMPTDLIGNLDPDPQIRVTRSNP